MAGPTVKGDLDVSEGYVSSIRSNEDLNNAVTATGSDTAKADAIIRITGSGGIIRTLPAGNATDMKVGWTIRYINDSSGDVTINDSAGAGLTNGVIATGLSVDVILVTSASPGTWKVIRLDRDETGVVKTTVPFFETSANGPSGSVNWGAASGNEYTITRTAMQHNAGTNPNVQVEQGTLSGTGLTATVVPPFTNVLIETVIINTDGDVSIRVNETPSGRFVGRIIIF